MARRGGWLVFGLWIFVLINAAGGVYALATGEIGHAGVHAVLLAVSIAALRRRSSPTAAHTADAVIAAETDQRMRQLQESLDAIALEVERIGEAQRFAAKLVAKQSEAELESRRDPSS